MNREFEEENLKADTGFLVTENRKPKTLVGQHYPRLGLHDAPSGAGIQNLEVDIYEKRKK